LFEFLPKAINDVIQEIHATREPKQENQPRLPSIPSVPDR
jgi:hypothetical protein